MWRGGDTPNPYIVQGSTVYVKEGSLLNIMSTEAQGAFSLIQAGKGSPEICPCSHAYVTILLRSEQYLVFILKRTLGISLAVQCG